MIGRKPVTPGRRTRRAARRAWGRENPWNQSVSAITTTRLLPGGGSYNCHIGSHLLAFFHAAHDDQAAVGNQEAAMIHGGVGGVVADSFPGSGAEVKSEGYRGRFGGLAVIAHPVVVVRVIGSAGEIDSARLFFQRTRPGRNAIARIAGMRRKFRPGDSGDVSLLRSWKLADPAFTRGDVPGIGSVRVRVCAVHVNDGVAEDGAGMAEHGRTGNRCSLFPGIFVGVVDLDVANGGAL